MENYILQTIAFQLVFLLVYELLLKKETFFTYSRIYLLVTPVLALLLPFLYFPVLQTAVPAEAFVVLPEVFLGAKPTPETASEVVAIAASETNLNWLWICYGIGAVISLLFFLKKYRALRKLFQNPVVSKSDEVRVIQVPGSDIACTFYKTIFLGDQLKPEEVEQIMRHELVHVKQKHSLDLLFFEVQKILFWFNPFIYIYQSRISVLHEFIADEGVVKKVEKRTYYEQMLNTAFHTKHISFINQFFNHSIIKKRIVMLQKSRSKTIAKFKYLILVPLMLVMLTYVACSEEIDDSTILKEQSTVDSSEILTVKVKSFGNRTPEEEALIKEALNGFNDSNYRTIRITDGTSGLEMTKDAEEGMPNISMIGEPRSKVEVQTTGGDPIGDVPFAVIEEVPVFPGCEEVEGNAARKECLSENITDFVNKNFNTGLGKELGLTGINRIYVQFRINESGSVEVLGARAPKPELETEARRVINLLPQMKPGQQNGKEVGVLYSLPITFKVGE